MFSHFSRGQVATSPAPVFWHLRAFLCRQGVRWWFAILHMQSQPGLRAARLWKHSNASNARRANRLLKSQCSTLSRFRSVRTVQGIDCRAPYLKGFRRAAMYLACFACFACQDWGEGPGHSCYLSGPETALIRSWTHLLHQQISIHPNVKRTAEHLVTTCSFWPVLPENWHGIWKDAVPKTKVVFHPPFLRCYISFRI